MTKIVKHNTFRDSKGESLNISRFVKYLSFSFAERFSAVSHKACCFASSVKSDKILCIKVAVSQTETLFRITKAKAANEDSNTVGQ